MMLVLTPFAMKSVAVVKKKNLRILAGSPQTYFSSSTAVLFHYNSYLIVAALGLYIQHVRSLSYSAQIKLHSVSAF